MSTVGPGRTAPGVDLFKMTSDRLYVRRQIGDRRATPRLEDALGDDRPCGQEQHRAEQDLEPVGELGRADRPEHEYATKCGRHRAERQPAHEVQVHGAPPEMHPAADRLHHDRGDYLARHRRQRVDLEEQHQNGGHERTAAHPGETDHEAHEEAGHHHTRIEVHPPPPAKPTNPIGKLAF
jgi:hypothetical protein